MADQGITELSTRLSMALGWKNYKNHYKKLKFGKKKFSKTYKYLKFSIFHRRAYINRPVQNNLEPSKLGCTFWESQVGHVIGSHVR